MRARGWLGAGAAIAVMAGAANAQAQGFDNAGVTVLHRAGIGDAAIVAKIDSVACGYDVSTAALIALKQAGVSDTVIAAMITRCTPAARPTVAPPSADPAAPHAPGIYVQDGSARQPIRPSRASGLKVGGNGSVFMPYVTTLVLPDPASHTRLKDARPVFHFYFAERRVSDFGSPNSGAAQSPDEFTLVRFRVKGVRREIGVGKRSAYGASRGIDPRAAVAFTARETGDGMFEVTPDQPLAAGEYGFVLTGASGASRVYDFSVP